MDFDVSLAGATARFAFTFQATDFKGRVTCFRLDPLKLDELKSVGHSEFNGQGDTAIKMPPGPLGGDPVLMGTDLAACYLLAVFLHKTLPST